MQKLILLVLFISLVFFMKSWAQVDKQNWESNRQKVEKLAEEGKATIFKKFYLGMDIYEFSELIKEYYPNFETQTWEVYRENKTYKYGTEVEMDNPNEYRVGYEGLTPFLAKADENKRVIKMLFKAEAVDKMFNSTDLGGEEFVKKFIDAYKIPNMDSLLNMGWTYKSPFGYKVTIMVTKDLSIESITPESNLQFN